MSDQHADPLEHPEVQAASSVRYIAAFVFAFLMMVLGALLTVFADFSEVGAYTWIALVGFIALIVQLLLLFKLDLSPNRFLWHALAFAGTIPLVVLAVGLTQFMFHFLHLRTMLGHG